MPPGITFPIDQFIMFPFGCQTIEFAPGFQKWRSLGIILGASSYYKSILARQENTGAMIVVPTIVLRENLPTRAEL